MDSENQLVVKSDPDIKLEIDIAADLECPFGPQQQCECTTSDSSENRGSSALTPHETDCWNPSDAAMKSEPASQPAMKSEPANQPAMKSEPASQPAMKSEPTSQPALSQPINHESTSQPTMTQPTSQSTFVEKIKAEPIDYTDDFIQPASQSAIVQGFKAEPDEHSGPFTSADLPSLPRTVKSEDSELNCLDNRSKVKLDWQSESNDADIICKTESVASDLRSNIFKIEIDVADTSNDVMAEEVTTNISGDIKTEPIPSTISSDVTTTDMINISDDIKTESCEPIPSTINSDDTAISGDIKTESCQCIPSTINSDDTAISCDIKTESCECIPSTISSDVTTTDMTESDITTTDMTTLNSNITTIEAAMTDVSSDVQTEAETDTMNFVSVISSRDEQRNRAAGDKEKKGRPVSTDRTSLHTSAITAGPLVMLNRCHVCQRCSAAFVLVSSWKQHMASAHGEKMLPVSTVSSTQSADVSEACNQQKKRNSTRRQQLSSSGRKLHKSNTSASPLPQNRSHVLQAALPVASTPGSNKLDAKERVGNHSDGKHVQKERDSVEGGKAVKQKKDTVGGRKTVERAKIKIQNTDTNRIDLKKNSRRHVCDVCSKVLPWPSNLKAHMVLHSGEKPFVCDVCSKAFAQAGNLKIHKRIHTGERPYKCCHCDADFSQSSNLDKHNRALHTGARHRIIHTGKNPHACTVWGKRFALSHALVRDRKTVERAKVKIDDTDTDRINLKKNSRCHVCDVCSKVFTWPSILKIHKRIHTGERPYKCRHCDADFSQSGNLNTHIRALHKGDRHRIIHTGKNPHTCTVWGKRFALSHALVGGRKTVERAKVKIDDTDTDRIDLKKNSRRHVCDVCSKVFTRPSNLKMHKRIHTGERPYKCRHCDANFRYLGNLDIHIRAVHTGDRPCVCQVCGAAFSRSGDLNRHRMIHTGEKPHACTVCGKRFAHKHVLITHALVHSGKKPHPCPHCPAAFTRPYLMKVHVHQSHQ